MPSHNRNAQRRSADFSTTSRHSSIIARGIFRRSQMPSSTPAPSSTNRSQKNGSSIFSKLLFNGNSKFSSKIKKQRYRSVLQVQSSLDQKEQYRKLIEQHRSSTQAPSEELFIIKNKKKDVEKKEKPDVIIDLDLTSTIVAGNLSAAARTNIIPVSNMSAILERTDKTLERTRERIKNLNENAQKNFALSNGVSSVTRIKSKSVSNCGDVNQSVLNNVVLKDFLHPPNRYLSDTFIPELLKSYNSKERERQREIAVAEARAKQFREKREAKEKMLAEILNEKLKIKEQVIQEESEEEEEEEDELPELTDEMEEEIDQALCHGPNQILADEFNIKITRGHMHTLDGLNWLNDEVINFYMELIVKRSKELDDIPKVHAMNTFFYPKLKTQSYTSVKRWTRRVDIFSKDIILFPIHLGVHWCLAIADFRKKELQYLDSMGGNGMACLRILKNYLWFEHLDKKKEEYDISTWKEIVFGRNQIPQQMNGSDCGVFTCKFAEYISVDATFSFSQQDMPYFRRAMVWEILNKSLLR